MRFVLLIICLLLELIRACDEMGMMVMAESFDEWKAMKVKNGYRHVFDEWAVKDLTNLLRHYRNNPGCGDVVHRK